MLVLLGIGIALILGIGMRIASYSGALMLMLMWLAVLLPEHNPLMDEHIIYALVMVYFAIVRAGRFFGLEEWFSQTFLKKLPKLQKYWG